MIGIMISCQKGFVIMANSHLLNMLGYSNEEVAAGNVNWMKGTAAEYYDVDQKALAELKEKGFCCPYEKEMIKKDGTRIFVLAGLEKIQNDVVAFVIDVTCRKIAEREAIAASAAKSRFIANVSHEIRTPLNAICGMIELLMDSNLNSEQKDYAKTVLKASETLRVLIHDILDFSKIEAQKVILEKVEFSLNFLLEEVVELLGETANAKEITLVATTSVEQDHLSGDSGRMKQILVNLIGNAIKFTPKGGHVIVTAETIAEETNSITIKISVEDTGIGISQEDQKFLFKPFSQIEPSSGITKNGTGLGLSISNQLAELMEGTMGVHSKEGEGSTFYFTVKLQKCSEFPKNPDVHVFEDIRALIFPKKTCNKIFVENCLKALQVSYSHFQSFDEFIPIAKDKLPNSDSRILIIVEEDFPLSQLTNMELIQSIANRTKIVVMDDRLKSFLDNGVKVENISKPFYFSKLRKSIMKWLFPTPSQTTNPSATQRIPKKNQFILLAEDNLVNQKVAIKQLEKLGYQAIVASNGLEVLKLLEHTELKFSLILMDCQMPEMDGLTCSELIREREKMLGIPRTPILALSAYSYADYRKKCQEAGMDDFISKPTTIKELNEKLNKFLPESKMDSSE